MFKIAKQKHEDLEANLEALKAGTPFQDVILATSIAKSAKTYKIPREQMTYDRYKTFARNSSHQVNEKDWDFIVENVYNVKGDSSLFQQVRLESGDVVDAMFIKDYDFTKLFFYDDKMLMTCETNIELMRADVERMFAAVMMTPKAFKALMEQENGPLQHHRV